MNSNILGKVVIPLVFLGMAVVLLIMGSQKTVIKKDKCLYKEENIARQHRNTVDSAYNNIKIRGWKNALAGFTTDIKLSDYLLNDSLQSAVDTLMKIRSQEVQATADTVYNITPEGDTLNMARKLDKAIAEPFFIDSVKLNFVKNKIESTDSLSLIKFAEFCKNVDPSQSNEADSLITIDEVLNDAYNIKESVYTQKPIFNYLAYALIILSIIMLLFSLGYLNKTITYILALILFFVVIALFIAGLYAIDSSRVHKHNKGVVYLVTKHRLLDIKDIQEKYYTVHGKFAGNFTEIKRFLNEDKLPVLVSEGFTPNRNLTAIEAHKVGLDTIKDAWNERMTDEQALKLGLIKRDTVPTQALTVLFTGEKALKSRGKRTPFNLDSLAFMAYSKDSLVLQSINLPLTDSTFESRFRVQLRNPWKENVNSSDCEEPEQLRVGSLEEKSTEISWGK